jgi:predicted TPR repeat methyltransferase
MIDRPALHPAVVLAPVDDGYWAYHCGTGKLHRLNAQAALIAELADGAHGIEELRTLVAPALPDGAAESVVEWIDEAAQAQLIVASEVAAALPRPTARQWTARVKKLRSNGKIKAAYVCQQRVAELTPDKPASWSSLGELAHILGRRGDCLAAYERYLDLNPDDPEIRHIVAALRDGPAPPRAPDECIQALYRRFSEFYEKNMCDDLSYEAPQRLAEALDSVWGERKGLRTLELGCGTGLAGLVLRPRAASLTGIDLSPEMVEAARKRKIYDELAVAEITAWLAAEEHAYDLIVACDTLIYFGDLSQVVTPAARLLTPGGRIVFSVERGEGPGFKLSDSGRYVHHPDHLRAVAAAAGLELEELREGYLRMEYGEEVSGLVASLRRAG